MVAQWVKTVANIVMMFILSNLLALILDGKIFDFASLLPYLCGILGVMIVRYLCGYFASKTSFYASSEVKKCSDKRCTKTHTNGCVIPRKGVNLRGLASFC